MCEVSRKEGERCASTILYEIMFPDDMHYVIKQIKKTLMSGETDFECYIKLLTFKKNIRTVVKTGKIRKEIDGIYIDIMLKDITNISNLHGKFEVNEEKLQSILSGSSVTVWDIKKKSCMWSKDVQLTLGVPAESENLVDTLCAPNMLHSDSAELFRNVVDRLMNGEVRSLSLQNSDMENSLKKEGFKVLQNNFPDSMLEKDIIYSEDLPTFMKIIQNIMDGKEVVCEFRIKNIYDKVEWYKLEYRIAFENEEPVYVVGKITNTEKEKVLVEQASVDSLTGCYNRGTTKRHIQQILSAYKADSQHAFIVVDIDNFKNINDNFGHIMGDTVLKELAVKMKSMFRGSDFVGRIGGDEFVIFMCEYRNFYVLEAKMRELVKILQTTYTGVKGDCSISGSIGIAVCPDGGITFEDLYCNADAALYVAKAKGKNQFCMYSKDMCQK